MNLNIDYINYNFVTILILVCFIFLLFNYHNFLKSNNNKFITKILLLLRLLILLFLFIFILNPLFSYKIVKSEPYTVNLFLDKSQSMDNNIVNSNINIESIIKKIENWSIENNFNINYYTFGSKVQELNSFNEISFDDTLTNFSNFHEYLINSNSNDILLISDGLNNDGIYNYNGIYNNKIYTLGIGDNYDSVDDLGINNIVYYENNIDSIKLIVTIKSNLNADILKRINLNNNKSTNLIIDSSIYFSGNNITQREIVIPKSYLSSNNYLTIDKNLNETNLDNNSYYLNIKNMDFHPKKCLLITGSISNNTPIIKNKILANLNDFTVNHIYRINQNKWNKDINSIDFNLYDFLFLDNFPIIDDDINLLNIINNNYTNFLAYNIGSYSKKSNVIDYFLNNFECSHSYGKYQNDLTIINLDNQNYTIPPHSTDSFIDCVNSKTYLNGNSIIIKNDKYLLTFFKNINNLDAQNILLGEENNISEFILQNINHLIYNRDKTLDLYTLHENYFVSEQIKVFMKINKNIDIDKIYLNIENEKYNINEKVYDKVKIENNFYYFPLKIKYSGNYLLTAKSDNYNKKNISSNIISVNSTEKSLELDGSYLNQNYLSSISFNSNGNYTHYTNIESLYEKFDSNEIEIVDILRKNIFTYKYFWIILIFLFSFEWYLRNRIGLL